MREALRFSERCHSRQATAHEHATTTATITTLGAMRMLSVNALKTSRRPSSIARERDRSIKADTSPIERRASSVAPRDQWTLILLRNT